MLNPSVLLLILGMALVTYIPRALPAIWMERLHFGPRFEKFLNLIPYTAMAALIFPGVLTVDSGRPWIGLVGAAAAAFPALARAGRPAEESNLDTSIRDYSIGEYKTYSEGTLELVLRDIKRMDNPVMEIQRTLVSFYGFDSLQAAEAAQK